MKRQRAACVGDVISNLHRLAVSVRYADSFLAKARTASENTSTRPAHYVLEIGDL